MKEPFLESFSNTSYSLIRELLLSYFIYDINFLTIKNFREF